jgi:hypothetical protein
MQGGKSIGNSGAAGRDEAVFLEAALGFFEDGVFDEAGGESRVEVVGAEGGAVGELEAFHVINGGEWWMSGVGSSAVILNMR